MTTDKTAAPDEQKPPKEKVRSFYFRLCVSFGVYLLIRAVLLGDDPLQPRSTFAGLSVINWPQDLQGYFWPFDTFLTFLGLTGFLAACKQGLRRRRQPSTRKPPIRWLIGLGLAFAAAFSLGCFLLPGVFGWLSTIELSAYFGLAVWGVLTALALLALALYLLGLLVILAGRTLTTAIMRRRAKKRRLIKPSDPTA